jgi:hypothetical protein
VKTHRHPVFDQLRHGPDVASGAKGTARASDHYHMNSPVAACCFQSWARSRRMCPARALSFSGRFSVIVVMPEFVSDVYLFVHKKGVNGKGKAVNGKW